MSQSRILPFLGPLASLYLVADLASSLPKWTVAAIVIAVTVPLLALLPVMLVAPSQKGPSPKGKGHLDLLGLGLGTMLLGTFVEASSTVSFAAAAGAALTGLLVVDLAWTVPDALVSRARLVGVRATQLAMTGLVFAALTWSDVVQALPALFFPEFVSVEWGLSGRGWAFAGHLWLCVSLYVAASIRAFRRARGGSPSSLASNGWTFFALVLAGPVASASIAVQLLEFGQQVFAQCLAFVYAIVLLLGHGAMLDSRVQNLSGTGIRRVVGLLVMMALAGFAGWLALGSDSSGSVPWAIAAAVGVATALNHPIQTFLSAFLAPFWGRVLHTVPRAQKRIPGAGSITELAEVVLPALRDAAGDRESEPLLFFYDPGHEVRIDQAGLAHPRRVPMPPILSEAFTAEVGTLLVRRHLERQIVRKPSIRPLVDALVQLDAEIVVPISFSGELEGAFVLPRGSRKGALALEELNALRDLARALSGPMALLSAKLRADGRTKQANEKERELRDRVEELEHEVTRLRADAGLWQGGAATRAISSMPPRTYAPALRALEKRADAVAPLSTPVLLVAEAGTNIDALARRIHKHGGRDAAPFVTGDCRATSEDEAHAALFGCSEEGRAMPGWLRLAANGTLLLVDLPALPIDTQRQLAEAFATHEAPLAGGASPLPVEARVVATAPVLLDTLVERGSIDAQLARWMQECELLVPPLRERREDIDSLLWLSVDQACRVQGRDTLGVSPDALELLRNHDWPGNEQELQWVVGAAVAKADGPRIVLTDLPVLGSVGDSTPDGDPLSGSLRDVEKRMLSRALDRAEGNKSEAARLLGLKRSTFLDKLRRHGIHPHSA